MKPKQLILSNPTVKRNVQGSHGVLDISEFFCDTIQGENFVGSPAAFLRLQYCTLSCHWCDTQEVWRFGNPYTFDELFNMMERPDFDLIRKFQEGQHLVLTGGSPLRQQEQLISFLFRFQMRYKFIPYIEVENECTLMPSPQFIDYISCWNNSPKLSNSGNAPELRYKPEVLRQLSRLDNSWFKFVVTGEGDWEEIQVMYLDTRLIRREQIVLMPQGATRTELMINRDPVVEMAVNHNVRYSTREHIILWDKKTGV